MYDVQCARWQQECGPSNRALAMLCSYSNRLGQHHTTELVGQGFGRCSLLLCGGTHMRSLSVVCEVRLLRQFACNVYIRYCRRRKELEIWGQAMPPAQFDLPRRQFRKPARNSGPTFAQAQPVIIPHLASIAGNDNLTLPRKFLRLF